MLPEHDQQNKLGFREAYLENEKQVRIQTGKVACGLVFVLMPLGLLVDRMVYPEHLWEFFELRLLCSLLIGGVWLLHYSPIARKHYPVIGLPIVILPAAFLSWMIYRTSDPTAPYHDEPRGDASPYYAGLNLILLAVSAVGRWSMLETILAVTSCILLYLVSYFARGHDTERFSLFFNNVYFLFVTGIIVACGNYLFNRLRFREFELRYELDQSRKALEQSNQKLLQLDEIKSRFFANISHELRTPLTLLLAPLETLLQRFHPEEATRDLLQTMHANGMRLLKLINDLLDLVRLESGKMELRPEPVEMTAFIRGLASAAQQIANDKRLALVTQIEPSIGTLKLDKDKLEKVVLNLLFNALKFTPAGGRVELSVQKTGDRMQIRVTDTGVGISEKHLPFIFQRFWQADGLSSRRYQGVGIGLALVKELVEIQKGSVQVQSQEGKGTQFIVELPCDPIQQPTVPTTPEIVLPPTPSSEAGSITSEEWVANLYRRAELFPALTPLQDTLTPADAVGNGARQSVLIADDEPDMLRFLKTQLSANYRVLEASDGNQAVEKAAQFLPDLIVLDMMMPEKDGLQVCRELRERTPTQVIPILLLTARADEETKLKALSAGANDFLAKPFSLTELNVRINNLVQSYAYQRKLAKQKIALESTIEQLKDTETQLVQSEKLASLGRMSAGIIHEINNPLNFAATGLFALRKKGAHLAAPEQQEYQEVLNDVEEGINRVKNIVTDLRTFTRADNENAEQVDVVGVTASALRFLSAEWKNRVRIEQNLPERLIVWANKNKLVQVMVNLLQNSLDALENKTFQQGGPTIWLEGLTEADKAILLVRDNGVGIAPEHQDKVFDPFFTTKDVGKGMGLGLSICYRILQQYNARITVRSEPGVGSEFKLEFPLPPPG